MKLGKLLDAGAALRKAGAPESLCKLADGVIADLLDIDRRLNAIERAEECRIAAKEFQKSRPAGLLNGAMLPGLHSDMSLNKALGDARRELGGE